MLEAHATLIALLVGTQAFFTGLAVLNLRHSERTIEQERDWLADEFAIDDTDELRAYHRISTGVGHLQSWMGLLLLLIVLYSGAFREIVTVVDSLGGGVLVNGVVFFVVAAGALVVFGLPFDAVGTFVVDEVFGFNQQSIRLWIRDAIVSTAISVVIVAIIGAAVLWFMMTLGGWWWVAGWTFFIGFVLAMNVIYPRVIAPMFNEFETIEEGPLRTAVEEVFDRAGFDCSTIYTMDASRRSSRVNAYFVGFGRTKRVVLFDTLIERLDREAIQSVLAHELAHWKRRHVWKHLGVQAVYMGAIFALLAFLAGSAWVYDMFAVPDRAYAGIVLGLVWLGPLVRLTSPLTNWPMLRFEREADRFAVEVMGSGDGLIRALTDLTRENLGNPFPHPWFELFHSDHPPVPERIRSIRSVDTSAG